MTNPPRHDWRAIVLVIMAGFKSCHKRKLTTYKLGEICGLDHSSIEHLLTRPGAQPKHWHGEVLLILYREYLPFVPAKKARRSGKIPIVRSDSELVSG